MTPEEIPLARRIIACGLPVPFNQPLGYSNSVSVRLHTYEHCTDEFGIGTGGYDPATRIMWQVVATGAGPELLPVLTDFALLGWLITELERLVGPVDIIDDSEPGFDLPPDWSVSRCEDWRGGPDHNGGTRIEALTAALEAAKAAK